MQKVFKAALLLQCSDRISSAAVRGSNPATLAVSTGSRLAIQESRKAISRLAVLRGRRQTDTMLATRMGCGESKAKAAEPQASDTFNGFKKLVSLKLELVFLT